jgi:hypothetical protein
LRIPVAGLLLIALASAGCRLPGAATANGATPGDYAPRYAQPRDLQPDAAPGDEAELVLAGTRLPVELRHSQQAEMLTLELLAHGELLEREVYRSLPEEFGLVEASKERYDPPLPLLRFPLQIGETWEWSGTMEMAASPRPVTATVATASDKLYLGEAPTEAVKVSVHLAIDAGPNLPPAKRELTFWFAPGRGLVRREFGAASHREPPQTLER